MIYFAAKLQKYFDMCKFFSIFAENFKGKYHD